MSEQHTSESQHCIPMYCEGCDEMVPENYDIREEAWICETGDDFDLCDPCWRDFKRWLDDD